MFSKREGLRRQCRAKVLIAGATVTLTGSALIGSAALTAGVAQAAPTHGKMPYTASDMQKIGTVSAAIARMEGPISSNDVVVDESGALRGEIPALTRELQDASGIWQPRAFFVDDFAGRSSSQWCRASFEASQMPADAVLLVVAVQQREYGFCLGRAADQSLNANARKNLDEQVRNYLSQGQWAGAVSAFARELNSSAASAPDANEPAPAADHTLTGTSPSLMTIIGGGLIALIGVGAIIFAWKRRGKATQTTPQPGMPGPGGRDPMRLRADQLTPNEVAAVLNTRVVRADDAYRSAQEDMEFARAEFGADTADRFRPALEQARDLVGRALAELEAANNTDNGHAREQHGRNAIQYADQVHAVIDAQTAEFERLREQQRNAGADLQRAREVVSDLRARLPQIDAELTQLAAIYPHTDLSSILDNPQQAQALLRSAEQAITDGEAKWQANQRQEAREYAAMAQRAIVQARLQFDAVLNAHSRLSNIDKALLEVITDLSALVNRAQASPRAGEFAPLIGAGQEAVAFAQAARAGQQDPLDAMERTGVAQEALERALGEVDDHAAHALGHDGNADSSTTLDALLQAAQDDIAQTNELISARRGALSAEPRRLLQAAQNELATALRGGDPWQRRKAAVRAQELARAARMQADAELRHVARSRDDDWGGFGSGGSRGVGGDLLSALLLGGILGQHNRGGYGGRSHQSDDDDWGSGWGGFGSSGSSFGGSFGGGSFGGGSFGGGSFGGGSSSFGGGKF